MDMGRKCRQHRLNEISGRELGLFKPRSFINTLWTSKALVERIDLYAKLTGHGGCVNAVEFNSTGELLVSGSDDKQVTFWDWTDKKSKMSYISGHLDNIFQTLIMPLSDDRKIVTSGADGQVRLGLVLENDHVDTKRLAKHHGRVFKLAVEPGSPYIFYSCGEDGLVQHFDLRRNSATKLFYCSPLQDNRRGRIINLNAIVINPRSPNYFSVAGSDEYARVYDIRKFQMDASSNSDRPVNTFCPHHLIKSAQVHITGLAYSHISELLVSYNDDVIYLFQESMGLGSTPTSKSSDDMRKLEVPQVYSGHRNTLTVKGVSFFGPNDDYVTSGSDCGHIYIWKKKGAELVRLIAGDQHIVNHLQPHPHLPVIASCGLEKKIKLWAPMGNNISPLPVNVDEIMKSNSQGREDDRQVSLIPDVIMNVLRLQRRQTMALSGRNDNISRASDSQSSREEGSRFTENPSDCNIS